MTLSAGWYQDSKDELRFWNGDSWGLGADEPSTTGLEPRYRTVGQPGIRCTPSQTGGSLSAETKQHRTAQALEQLLDKYPQAWLFHSVRLDGLAWDIDHVLVVGRVVIFVDSRDWHPGHDYLLQFDNAYDPPEWWGDRPSDRRFLKDRVVRWNRVSGNEWEPFPGSTIDLRGMSERFPAEAGITDATQFRFVPLLLVASDDVKTQSDQPGWMHFTDLAGLENEVDEILRTESRLADGHEPSLRSLFTKLQGNAIAPEPPTTDGPQPVPHPGGATPVPYPAAATPVPYSAPAPPVPYTAAAPPAPYSPAATPAPYPPAAYPQATPVYAHPAQPSAPTGQSAENNLAIPAMVIGIVSLFLPLFLGMIVAGTGLGLSIGAMIRAGRTNGHRLGMAITGLVTSIVGLVLII